MLRYSRKLSPFLFASSLIAGLSLTGCGGGGQVQIGPHYYPGSWSGTVTTQATSTTSAGSGTMTLVIDSSDNITGTDTISIPGTTTNDTGSIAYSGAFTINSVTSGSKAAAATFTGTLTVVADVLQGTGTMTVGTTSVPAKFELKIFNNITNTNQ